MTDHRPDDADQRVDDDAIDSELDVTITTRARTFVVTATGSSIAAFNVGFDLGAFGNIDHRKIWTLWIISTVALIASYLFRDSEYRLGWWWRLALLVPTLWIVIDAFVDDWESSAFGVLALLSLVALPLAIFVIVRLVGGQYFELTARLRVALVITTAGMFAAGVGIGWDNPRFLDCEDFRLAGEFEPENCNPDD